MLPPRYLEGIADEIAEIYSILEIDILQDMARRLARLGKVTTTTRWQADLLVEMGGLKKTIDRVLKKYDREIVDAVKRAYVDALQKSTDIDNRIFKDATGRTVSAPTAQVMLATIQKARSDLARLTLTTAATSEQAFVEQANKIYMQVNSGAFDYQQAMRYSTDDLARQGVTMVQYENGRPVKRSIEAAVRMNVLTGVNQTASVVTLNNAQELGCDLVETSAHMGARPEHAAWQGRVFSLSGTSSKYPSFDVCGYGTATGICGVNCRHSFYPYFEGTGKHFTASDLDELADEEITYNGKTMSRYDAEQEQRAIERNIRKYKRQALTQEAGGVDSTRAREYIGKWQAKARNFVDQTGLKRDYIRERVGTATGKQPRAK